MDKLNITPLRQGTGLESSLNVNRYTPSECTPRCLEYNWWLYGVASVYQRHLIVIVLTKDKHVILSEDDTLSDAVGVNMESILEQLVNFVTGRVILNYEPKGSLSDTIKATLSTVANDIVLLNDRVGDRDYDLYITLKTEFSSFSFSTHVETE